MIVVKKMLYDEIQIMKADIDECYRFLNDKKRNRNAPYDVNMFAYHSNQAIEKGLKIVLSDVLTKLATDSNTTTKQIKTDYYNYFNYHNHLPALRYTHDTVYLLALISKYKPEFVPKHQFLYENSETLSSLNNIRYGKKEYIIQMQNIFLIMQKIFTKK